RCGPGSPLIDRPHGALRPSELLRDLLVRRAILQPLPLHRPLHVPPKLSHVAPAPRHALEARGALWRGSSIGRVSSPFRHRRGAQLGVTALVARLATTRSIRDGNGHRRLASTAASRKTPRETRCALARSVTRSRNSRSTKASIGVRPPAF